MEGLEATLSRSSDGSLPSEAFGRATILTNALEKVTPMVQKSRAGEGSQPVIGASVGCLALGLALVALLYKLDDGDGGGVVPAAIVGLPSDSPLACNDNALSVLIEGLVNKSKEDGATDAWRNATGTARLLKAQLAGLGPIGAVGLHPAEPEPEAADESLWYVGVGMSCSACLANVFGYNLVRKTHSQVSARHLGGDLSAKPTQYPVFFIGWFLSIVFCAGLDIIAYGFAPVEMLAPLSGVTLVLNIWVAPLINGEKVFTVDVAVCLLIMFGIVVTVESVPKAAFPIVDGDFLWEHFWRENYLLYEAFMIGSSWIVYTQIQKVYGDYSEAGIAKGRAENPKLSAMSIVLWPWVGSVFTSNMNVFVKCFLEYIKGGASVLATPWPYFLFALLLSSTMLQLNAINQGLAREGALTFVPIKSAMNVMNMSMHSCAFFQTLDLMGALVELRYFIGLICVTTGVLLILARPLSESELVETSETGGDSQLAAVQTQGTSDSDYEPPMSPVPAADISVAPVSTSANIENPLSNGGVNPVAATADANRHEELTQHMPTDDDITSSFESVTSL